MLFTGKSRTNSEKLFNSKEPQSTGKKSKPEDNPQNAEDEKEEELERKSTRKTGKTAECRTSTPNTARGRSQEEASQTAKR